MAAPRHALLAPSSLVGRDRELHILRDHREAAFAGHGGLVLIGGEAGVGKTALAEAACREAAERGALALVGRCFDLSETPPYGPWVELFGGYEPGDGLPGLPAAFAQPGIVGAVANQAALFQQVRDFFTALAATRPLVILLDDVHWADQASLDLLRVIARHQATSRLLLVATYRTDAGADGLPLSGMLPTLVREGHAERINLRELHDEAVRGLVAARYGLPDADTDRLTAYLKAHAQGNPFFLGELLRALQEAAILRPTAAGWSLHDLVPIGVPALLKQVIGGRLARIDEPARRLLALAAVIGQEVPLTLWRVVAGVEEEVLLTTIEQAAGARLLDSSPTGTHVRFAHALIRQTLYEGMLPARRRILHQRIADALATASDGGPDAVAYHFQQAQDARAISWLIAAGERAERLYAWLTAADRFEAAARLIDASDGDAAERGWLLVRIARLRRYTNPRQGIAYLDCATHLAHDVHDELLQATALFHRGLLLCFVGAISRGLTEMEAAVAARKGLAAAHRARIAAAPKVFALHEGEDGEEALVLWLAYAGRYAEARALGECAIGGTPTQFRTGTMIGAHQNDIDRGLGQVYAMLGLPDEARVAFALAPAGLRAEGNFVNLGMNAIDELHYLLPYDADRLDARERHVAEAAAAWRLAGDESHDALQRFTRLPLLAVEGRWAELRRLPLPSYPALEWTVRGVRGPVLRQQGEAALAWDAVRAVLPEGPTTPPGNVRFFVAIGCQRLAAALALDDGDLDTARAWLEAHDRWLAWSGAVLGRADGDLSWAAYHRAAGEPGLADARASAALRHATMPRQPLALLAAHRLLGELDTERGEHTDAAVHLDVALALADACAAPFERALTLLAMAELRAVTGNRAEAAGLLDEARAICAPRGALPALARADALAARLGSGVADARAYPDGLTDRETAVLRLVAAGRSNRQIAETLSISTRTVNRHIENVYRKTGAHNRADATAYAFRHHLT